MVRFSLNGCVLSFINLEKEKTLADVAAGNLARIAPNILLMSDPELYFKINGARSRYTKSPRYLGNKLEADNDNVFSGIDEAINTKKRHRLAFGVSYEFQLETDTNIDH
jgi:hypothetical protein